ncbi:ABC transporter substrate-binding protein [Bradyrhizobium australiense]|uniref:ABC transporter substrate-binding protein n=1 Tax=Bradyrhizobium australiense TaxID=2721161 RepID=A0A7Y4GS18_9BRAD|nr:ABC transporter substrate-binding protein [Bradyrhizobium australiense]NOJ40944.1 ABC transporter substrate-binding protein [Bradyrhizobium australiense]
MRRIIVAFLIVASALAWHGVSPAIAAEPEPRLILAPTGVLRAGLYPGTPTSILPDTGSGEPRGVGHDLGKELARRLGVPYEPVVFAKNAEVLAALKSGEVDVAFTNATAARARDMDFGPPFLEIELGYLVPRGSTLTTPAEMDCPGRRIGVTAGSSSDATLSRDFKHAEIVRAATFDVAIEMLSAGAISAYATNKAALFEMSEKLRGSKVLDGRWGIERHAIAIPKGREQAMDFVRQFTNEVKSEGVVRAAIVRAGLRGAAESAAE